MLMMIMLMMIMLMLLFSMFQILCFFLKSLALKHGLDFYLYFNNYSSSLCSKALVDSQDQSSRLFSGRQSHPRYR